MNISHITYQLSNQSKTVFELADNGEFLKTEATIFDKLMGLKYIPRYDNISHLEQIVSVFNLFQSEASVHSENISYIFYAHTGDTVAPSHINILHEIKNIFHYKNAVCMGSSLLKCASAFQLLRIANALLSDMKDDESILILIADLAFTPILRHIPGSTVMGDAATLLLLSNKCKHHKLIDSEIKIDGRFSKGMWGDHDEQLLFQSIYNESVCQVITDITNRNHLNLSQIKCIFPHNVNFISWKQIISSLALDPNQIYLNNISKTAHCFGSDPFINLKDAVINERIHPGDYTILVTVGLGAVFSALLLQY